MHRVIHLFDRNVLGTLLGNGNTMEEQGDINLATMELTVWWGNKALIKEAPEYM